MRQAVFSSMGERVAGSRVLDLFAGTGAYGLDALSRGAASVRFVELDRSAVRAIGRNVQAVCKSMGAADASACFVEGRDVFSWTGADKYDLIFADPPYSLIPTRGGEILDVARRAIAPGGLFIMEMPGELDGEAPGWTLVKRLGKGRGGPSTCFYEIKSS
jgi:16S rRNA (guanine966-N2)-methyltransferase